MTRLLELTRHFDIPTGVCINKSDLNEKLSTAIENEVTRSGADFIGRIHFDHAFTRAQKEGAPLLAHADNRTAEDIRAAWVRLLTHLERPASPGDGPGSVRPTPAADHCLDCLRGES
jgi:MinD superfamily P-loop ATPase